MSPISQVLEVGVQAWPTPPPTPFWSCLGVPCDVRLLQGDCLSLKSQFECISTGGVGPKEESTVSMTEEVMTVCDVCDVCVRV